MSRRRSAIVPPPGPPPSQPIPHLPPTHVYDTYDDMAGYNGRTSDVDSYDSHSPPQSYARPSASANLAAVAAFSQNRHATYASSAASSSVDNLSDSPPPSRLRSGARSPTTNDIVPDRLLLSPPEPRSSEPRPPSSRRALTKALELAREAVKLDSTNDDPYGAVIAYGKSVSLLSEVMERVMRGEDSTERRRNGRRRSVVAQEEEVRRLKSIHDTYADRMNILSLIYSIPLPTTSPPSTYASSSVSVSTASTTPSSPTSTSPTSESSHSSRYTNEYSDDGRGSSDIPRIDLADNSDDMLAIGTAMFSMDTSMSSGGYSPRTPVAPSVHPYAASTSPSSSRMSAATPPRQVGRTRASSSLPPPPPPPTTLPPAAPAPPAAPFEPQSTALRPPELQGRQRGASFSHRRNGSYGRLAALQEEGSEKHDDKPVPTRSDSLDTSHSGGSGRRSSDDSHPLPPLPPTPSSHGVNGTDTQPNSPTLLNQRPRGSSNISVRQEVQLTSPLINASTAMGMISQRRIIKTSVTSSMSTSSEQSDVSSVASSLPASSVASLSLPTRSRASSQPPRPLFATAKSYPVPHSALPGGQPRKVSIPSRLNPNAPPQITINTALLSPPLSKTPVAPLVPPPPVPHGSIPMAPQSPLPPNAPTDPLRKPYHMMILLRQTMTSKTGGYITRRLHVPQEVWSQGGAKLTNIPEKIRVVEVLCSALEEIQSWSVEYFGAGNVSSGMGMGIGSIGKKEAEAWSSKLEELLAVCDGVVGNFGKKLGVGEGFVTKKSGGKVTSWGGRLTRQFDKLTNGKNLDSPAIYVQGLAKLFNQVQILDEHTKAVCGQPIAPLYAAFPPEYRTASETRLRRASEFFAKVVLTFVIRDMALLLDKYVKKCEKWLAE
ncbi:hypothetical protein PsYK624_020540 [Phanerochaete sordida]|uniref:MIT domain-containing protein n=1 Tax=Phanerochaete sordida TaxID=48140 RepID=A0A9P3L8Y6_9APHY|nr:hypothetical protein PsYK624_020540 [Phanerochaete sordida]